MCLACNIYNKKRNKYHSRYQSTHHCLDHISAHLVEEVKTDATKLALLDGGPLLLPPSGGGHMERQVQPLQQKVEHTSLSGQYQHQFCR